MSESVRESEKDAQEREVGADREPLNLDDYMLGPSGIGPQAWEWLDKPHRLVYDLCAEVRTLRTALRLTRTYDEHRWNCRVEGCRECDVLRGRMVKARCTALGDEKNPIETGNPASSEALGSVPSAAQK